MIVVVESNADDFGRGITSFLNSLTWLYLRHRYPTVAQGNLLRALTLSGLASWWWERCVAYLASGRYTRRSLFQLLAPAHGEMARDELRQAAEAIWAYAAARRAPVGDPPLAPVYLTGYGYTQAAYLADLEQLYDSGVAARYQEPWVEGSTALQKAAVQPDFLFRPAVAIMGATAGAIERLMAMGADDADRTD